MNTESGWRIWPECKGGGYGGNCDGSEPFETGDVLEIIDEVPLTAILSKRQAFWIRFKNLESKIISISFL